MFKGFNVTLDASDSLFPKDLSSYKNKIEKNKKHIQKSLKDFLLDDGSIDGEKLKQEWFPDLKNTHVFISHSHRDIDLAERLACWLYDNFKIRSFIDSHVWGYANDLLKELDNKYAYSPTNSIYDYDIRNETTSHVHMMLSSALNEMIDRCECLFFLNTDNAIKNIALSSQVDDHRTASPWIMSELVTSTIIRKKQNITRVSKLNESVLEKSTSSDSAINNNLIIQHKAPINHLIKLDNKKLEGWEIFNFSKDYNALTWLYNIYTGEKFEISDLGIISAS
ncbi:hypothetical protein [Photobacterium angustum]|uniref:hypothetical protein n=1 Tax=Photobacterium angustum TaxID=661 RepID=UPI0005DF8A6C|nr:hypothetical protein [Photobacterium angustum]KJG02188.1 hypothetical protein UB35_08570 [Photobacterium angustum]PSV67031.1 hypothetical protein CTM95_10365 [Photobacterium angustum]